MNTPLRRLVTTGIGQISRRKAIFIVGTTGPSSITVSSIGVGKTKLSIQLAHRYDGEIINADAMQMYKGLNVATAKVAFLPLYYLGHHGRARGRSPSPSRLR